MVSYFIKTDLTGNEIERLIGRPPVLYSDLAKYSSLKQLLGSFGYVVVLYQTSSRLTGHYVAITQNSQTGKIRYCDSYGLKNPDVELQYTPYDKSLPQYLTKLLSPYTYESNTVDYQARNPSVSTCGRYASLFCMFRDLTLVQIDELFKGNQVGYLNNPDHVAVLLTLSGLNDITKYLDSVPRGRQG